MRKSLLNLVLSGAVIFTSLTAHAGSESDPIGGLIKNKKTKEYLGTRCVETTSDAGQCKSIIFSLYEKNGDSFIHLKDVGSRFSYGLISTRLKNDLRKKYPDRYYPEYTLDELAVDASISVMDDALNDGYYSTAGAVWRFTAGLVLFPVTLIIDGVRYAVKAVGAGAISVYEITEEQVIKGKVNRSYKGMLKASRKTYHGKVIKMSGKNFEKLLNVITERASRY